MRTNSNALLGQGGAVDERIALDCFNGPRQGTVTDRTPPTGDGSVSLALAELRGLEGVTLRNPLKINAATSKVGTTNSLAGVHDPERKSWVAVAPVTPA